MCGILGYSVLKNYNSFRGSVPAMAARIMHRGPDHQDYWFSPNSRTGLGHCRLSIIDLSPQGHQPMVSHSGRYVLVYNGEVYNFRDLKETFLKQGFSFHGHSDTEVVLQCIEAYGLTEATLHLNGMFAFACYDTVDDRLHLVRDRFGEKPLYYYHKAGVFLFASELHSFKGAPVTLEVNRDALSLYFKYGYIPAPYTIYENVYKLEPGHHMVVQDAKIIHSPKPYWTLNPYDSQKASLDTDEAALERVSFLLKKSVKNRMISDVSLGAFLSGGIDSSLIVALMQEQSTQRVKTFTIGFDASGFDEARHAEAIAKHLGTDHLTHYIKEHDILDSIPSILASYDEPFADSSAIPTQLVCAIARKKVSVALTGDAGDEFFGGYNRYLWAPKLTKQFAYLPQSVARGLFKACSSLSTETLNKVLMGVLGKRVKNPGEKILKTMRLLTQKKPHAIYKTLVSSNHHAQGLVLGAKQALTLPVEGLSYSKQSGLLRFLMHADCLHYLPNDILCKVDRAAMSVSLESRIPYLDYDLIDYVWQLPLSLKVRGGKSKWLLRSLLGRYVPLQMWDRPKSGFEIPLSSWLKGGLRPWVESLLETSKVAQEGFLNSVLVGKLWTDHLNNKAFNEHLLWSIIAFEVWLEHNA